MSWIVDKLSKTVIINAKRRDFFMNKTYYKNLTMTDGNDLENHTFTFFGPVEMAFYEGGDALEEADSVLILISVFMATCMVLSLMGNVCTCAVIARDRSMRTPTNCYLLNLAITDILTALYVPIEIYMLWIPKIYPFGEVGCRIHLILWDCLSNCSVLTISAFTVERYLVVTKPFLRQKLSRKSRVFKIIGVIWVVAICFCIPDLFYIDLLEKKKYVYCYFTISETFLSLEVFVSFVVPMTIISVLYVLIAMKLKSSQPKLRSSPVVGNQRRDKAVKMLAIVAALFFFCWAPFCVMRIMMIVPYENDEYYDLWRVVNYLSTVGVYTSTAVNPFVYSLMSHKFRQAFKDYLRGCKCPQKPPLHTCHPATFSLQHTVSQITEFSTANGVHNDRFRF